MASKLRMDTDFIEVTMKWHIHICFSVVDIKNA